MAIQSDHHGHWIDGSLERLLLVAVLGTTVIAVMAALSPFAFLFYW